MQTITLVLLFLLLIIIIRLVFRNVDFPGYSGPPLADDSNIEGLMPESTFWKLIQDSRSGSRKNYELQCQLLSEQLASMNSHDIVSFNRTFQVLMAKTYSFKLWEAAYSLNGGCSDDAFEYFRTWLISLGRNKFYRTIKSPRLLIFIGVKELIQNYEGLGYCAYEAYNQKTGNEIPPINDIKYDEPGKIFNEGAAFLKYPELALLAW